VWVTPEELVQIAEYLKMTPEQFEVKYLQKVGSRRTLIETRNYDCIFLQRDGDSARCLIYPVRPQQCRTWPFWKRNIATPDSWNRELERCPGINRGRLYTCEEIEETAKNSPC